MLNTQKKRFAEERLKGCNQTEAAKRAGYSEKTAYSKGNQLAKDKDVIEYTEKLKAKQAKAAARVEKVAEPEPQPTQQPEPDQDNAPELAQVKTIDDPLAVMRQIMNDNLLVDPKLSLEAAKALAVFTVSKPGEAGKKEQKNAAAKKAASKFQGMAAPKLIVNNQG